MSDMTNLSPISSPPLSPSNSAFTSATLSSPAMSDANSNMEGNLVGAYGGRRRDLLELLNKLHNLGIQNVKHTDVPQIAVVGSQSAGKSSLIESMSGISLPRASGTCTRCPMECHLEGGGTEWSCTVSLRFSFDRNDHELANTYKVDFGPRLTDKERVKRTLERAQMAILHPWVTPSQFLADPELAREKSEQPGLTFSRNCVCIHVVGPEVPDLLFFDLPGVIANVADGGNESDIHLIENLVNSYITRQSCIILLVVSCETDFENQGAGRLVLKKPKLKQRTVGVLTKVDRIPSGDAARWADILCGKSNTVPQGWFAVKQPDTAQVNSGVTWKQARELETSYFRVTDPWHNLSSEHQARLGSEPLAEHLGSVLADLVLKKLPEIHKAVLGELRHVVAELKKYPTPDFDKPDDRIHSLIRLFIKEVEKHVQGLALASSAANVADPFQAGLIQTVHAAIDEFSLNVHRTAPQFFPWRKGTRVNSSWVTDATRDDAPTGRVGDIHYIDGVMDLAKKSRTRELPGIYPFAVRVVLIEEALKDWRTLATNYLQEVDVILRNHLDRLVQLHFKGFDHGGLLDAVRQVVVAQVADRFTITEKRVEGVCESEHPPWTQNDRLYFDYRDQFLVRYRAIYRESDGSAITLFNKTYHARQQAVNNAVSALAQLSIHNISATDLAKLLPGDELDPALDIMAEVRAYFQVAYKRFVDEVPISVDAFFIRPIPDALDAALMRLMRKADPAQCLLWLQESPTVAKRREELLGKKQRLEEALESLMPALRQAAERVYDSDGEDEDDGASQKSLVASVAHPVEELSEEVYETDAVFEEMPHEQPIFTRGVRQAAPNASPSRYY